MPFLLPAAAGEAALAAGTELAGTAAADAAATAAADAAATGAMGAVGEGGLASLAPGVSSAVSGIGGGLSALDAGLAAGSSMASGTAGLTASADALANTAAANAFNAGTSSAIQEALAKQAAESLAQNSLGTQAFQAFNPLGPGSDYLSQIASKIAQPDAFVQQLANPENFVQQLTASGAPVAPNVIEQAAQNEAGRAQIEELAKEQAAKTSEYLPENTTPTDYASRMREIYQPSTSSAGNTLYQPSNWGSQDLANQVTSLDPKGNWASNLMQLARNPSMDNAQEYLKLHPQASAMGAYGLYSLLKGNQSGPKANPGLIRPYTLTRTQNQSAYAPTGGTAERNYFNDVWTAGTPYTAPGPEYRKANGGIVALGIGGPVEQMSAENAVGDNSMYPQAGLQTSMYSNPMVQRPMPTNVIKSGLDAAVDPYTGEERLASGGAARETTGQYTYSFDPATSTFTQTGHPQYVSQRSYVTPSPSAQAQANAAYEQQHPFTANGTVSGGIAPAAAMPPVAVQSAQPTRPINVPAYQSPEQQLGLSDFYANMNEQLGMMGYANGGIASLGGYSDGGHLLKGPGDGVSDSIPAVIGDRQPARLADGEFVVPARIVSELGNGSTDAGARKLYAMMDRVQKNRSKSIGKDRVAVDSKADKHLPA